MSQHWRTARANSGGDGHSHGPPHAHDTQRDSLPPLPRVSIISRGMIFEGSDISDPPFDEREFGAHCLVFGLLLAAAVFVLAVYFGYQAFVS